MLKKPSNCVKDIYRQMFDKQTALNKTEEWPNHTKFRSNPIINAWLSKEENGSYQFHVRDWKRKIRSYMLLYPNDLYLSADFRKYA